MTRENRDHLSRKHFWTSINVSTIPFVNTATFVIDWWSPDYSLFDVGDFAKAWEGRRGVSKKSVEEEYLEVSEESHRSSQRKETYGF